jgi:hypothetical protein
MVDFIRILQSGQFRADPFPHWIVENVLDQKILDSVENSYPTSKYIHKTLYDLGQIKTPYDQNTAYSLEFDMINDSNSALKNLSKDWCDQKNYLLEHIADLLPLNIRNNLDTIKNISFSRGDFRASSPVTIPGTTQLGPHLDSAYEILAGLIYLKMKDDKSEGGNLEIYELVPEAPINYMSVKRRVPTKYLQKIYEVPYKNNIGIFFISHPRAIHGISSRSVTPFDRRLVNLSIELPEDQTYRMFDHNKLTDFELTHDSKYKLIRVLHQRLGIRFRKKNKTRFGKYNWVGKDEI